MWDTNKAKKTKYGDIVDKNEVFPVILTTALIIMHVTSLQWIQLKVTYNDVCVPTTLEAVRTLLSPYNCILYTGSSQYNVTQCEDYTLLPLEIWVFYYDMFLFESKGISETFVLEHYSWKVIV